MRRAAEIPLDVVIVDPVHVPAYLRIAENAKHLSDLGMSDKAIAARARRERQDGG